MPRIQLFRVVIEWHGRKRVVHVNATCFNSAKKIALSKYTGASLICVSIESEG